MGKMAKRRNFLQMVPAFAQIVGLGSVIIWILKAVVLDHIQAPALFFVDLGRVFEGVLSAIFAGYVFYILFALWPEYRDRRVLTPYISKNLTCLVGDCVDTLKEVGQASGRDLPLALVNNRQIEAACKAVSTNVAPRMVVNRSMTSATWIKYFIHQRDRTQRVVGKLYDVSKFLTPDLISLITELEDCAFFNFIDQVQYQPFGNSNLSEVGAPLAGYASICLRIARWHDCYLKGAVVPIAPKLR